MDRLDKDWTDELPQMMDSFAEAEPEGLWDAVLSGMGAHRRRRVAVVWWYSAAALAVAAALAAFLILRTSLPSEVVSSVPGDELVAQDLPSGEASGKTPDFRTEGPESTDPSGKPDEIRTDGDVSGTPSENAADSEADNAISHTPESEDSPLSARPERRVPTDFPAPPEHPARQRRSVRIHAGISTGNLLAADVSQITTGYGIPSNPGTKAMQESGNYSGSQQVSNPYMLSRNKASSTESVHSQSARIGFSLGVGLTDRLSIESGLVLTTLSSTFNTQVGSTRSETKRTMRYIGIPLTLKFDILDWKGLGLYAAAGPMYEFCTGAKQSSRNYLGSGSTITGKDEEFSPSDNRWSLGVGAGLQYMIPGFGALFVQPGYSWHFANSSTLESYYTEHPAAFSLTVGYRFTL